MKTFKVSQEKIDIQLIRTCINEKIQRLELALKENQQSIQDANRHKKLFKDTTDKKYYTNIENSIAILGGTEENLKQEIENLQYLLNKVNTQFI